MKRLSRISTIEIAKSRAMLVCFAILLFDRFLLGDSVNTLSSFSLLFLVVSSALIVCGLELCSYFHVLYTVPRRSDSLLAVILFPTFFLLQSLIIFLLGVTLPHTANPLLRGILCGILFAFIDYFVARKLPVGTRKIRVVLDVLPLEAIQFIRTLRDLDIAERFELFPSEEIAARRYSGKLSSIDLIVISHSKDSQLDADGLLVQAHLAGVPVRDSQSVLAELSGKIDIEHCDQWSYLISATPQNTAKRVVWFAKKVFEPLAALFLFLLFLPLLVLIAIGVRLTSKGPILFCQRRTGFLGSEFVLFKFRSMRLDAEAAGPAWSSRNDNRITQFGTFLRATRLDELPQLWNVIRGEMSFCGPRPERPEMYEILKREIPLFALRTIVKPGITGWAQVQSGYAASVAQSKIKLEHDLYYIQNMSPKLDFAILIRTLFVALRLECPRAERRIKQSPVLAAS